MYIEVRKNLVIHFSHVKNVTKAPNTEKTLIVYFSYDYDIIKLIAQMLKVDTDFMYVYYNKIGLYDAHVIKDINEYLEARSEQVVTMIHDYLTEEGASIERI